MRYQAIFLAGFFICCLGVTGYFVSHSRRVPVVQGFTLLIDQTSYPKDKDPILTATKTRYQKANGDWKLETRYSNGRVDIGYGQQNLGVVHVDEQSKKLDFISQMNGLAQSFDDDYWRRQPGFIGEETIHGYKTFHLHWEQNGEYSDNYICPSLQNYPLRMISGNEQLKTIFEVTRVIVGEPIFDPAPAYPLDQTNYKKVHTQN